MKEYEDVLTDDDVIREILRGLTEGTLEGVMLGDTYDSYFYLREIETLIHGQVIHIKTVNAEKESSGEIDPDGVIYRCGKCRSYWRNT